MFAKVISIYIYLLADTHYLLESDETAKRHESKHRKIKSFTINFR